MTLIRVAEDATWAPRAGVECRRSGPTGGMIAAACPSPNRPSCATDALGKGKDHAKRTLTVVLRRRRIADPTMAKPPIIIAQVAGSGTGAVVTTVPFR